MSTSSFHKHFKSITTSSPLQYQKDRRLLEARRQLRTGATSVTTVAFDVGYQSPTQFSREYARKFGAAPKHELPVAEPTTRRTDIFHDTGRFTNSVSNRASSKPSPM